MIMAHGDRRVVIAKLTSRGASTREIAKRLGVSVRTVNRDRVSGGLPDGNARAREIRERRRAAVAELCRDGLGTGVIAHRLGIDNSTVQRDRVALGIADHNAQLAMTREERRDVVEKLCTEGWFAREIAKHLGTTTRTVERDKEARGLTRWHNTPITAEEHQRARAMLADGHSLIEVARTLGRNPSHIGKLYRGQGWTPEQTGQFNRLRGLRERLELIDGG